MKTPFKGADILLYLDNRVDSARITEVEEGGKVCLVAFPSDRSQVNSQARDAVPYGPGIPGCWGWNQDLENNRHITGQVIAGHRVVTLNDADRLIYASHQIPVHAIAPLYLSLNAADLGGSVAIARDGLVQEQSWNWQPEQPIFLSTEGQLTQNYSQIRAGPGFVLTVAIALSETSILFAPKTAVLCLT